MFDFARTRWSKAVVAAVAVIGAMPCVLAAQGSKGDANAIRIPVVAYDKKGNLLENLTQGDFVLEVDRKAQPITSFRVEKDTPVAVGVLVDTTSTQRGVLDEIKTGTAAYLSETLTAGANKAFVVQFARQIDLLQDTTTSPEKVKVAMQLVNPSAERTESVTAVSNDPHAEATKGKRNDTLLYDALFLASDELMKKETGRKVLIVISDGADAGSKETLGSAIEAAQRADAMVYAIYFKGARDPDRGFHSHIGMGEDPNDPNGGGYPGDSYPGGGYPGGYPGGGYPGGTPRSERDTRPDGRKVLERMARETGGRLFEISGKGGMADIYKEIASELRAQYRLEYLPGKETGTDGYHRVSVTVKNSPKEFYLQTRDGYFVGE
jgi:VWFA-related protein